MKRLSLITVVALAGITLAALLATSGSAQQPGELTLRFVERASIDRFVDNPPRGDRRTMRISGGDFVASRAPIYDESNTTRRGTLHSVCVATRGGTVIERVSFQCSGTFVLREGTLALNFGGQVGQAATAAITGGTGAFEGRTGSAVSKSRPNSSLSDDTIHLVP
jgi:hypothetical protein